MPGRNRQYSPEEKEQAGNYGAATTSSIASILLSIPESTVRSWMTQIEGMDDSESDAFVCQKKRLSGPLWSIFQELALRRGIAVALDPESKPGQLKDLAFAAGIANTKLEGQGQPKDITPSSPASPSLLREIPGLSHDKEP